MLVTLTPTLTPTLTLTPNPNPNPDPNPNPNPNPTPNQVGLLHVWETARVGCTPEGFLAIYSHPWFAEIDWQAVTRYH